MAEQDKTPLSDTELAARLQARLSELEGDLDELSSAKLRAARLRAVEHAGRQSRPWRLWLPAAATAMLLVVVTSVWLQRPVELAPAVPAVAFEDMELLAGPEELEFYESLEFVTWLAEQSEA